MQRFARENETPLRCCSVYLGPDALCFRLLAPCFVCSTGLTLLGESHFIREVLLAGMDHAYSHSIARIYCFPLGKARGIARDHSVNRMDYA